MGKKTGSKYANRARRGWKGMTTNGYGRWDSQGVDPESPASIAKKKKARKKAAQSRKQNRGKR
jgi:hypothetical protein